MKNINMTNITSKCLLSIVAIIILGVGSRVFCMDISQGLKFLKNMNHKQTNIFETYNAVKNIKSVKTDARIIFSESMEIDNVHEKKHSESKDIQMHEGNGQINKESSGKKRKRDEMEKDEEEDGKCLPENKRFN